MKIVLLKPVNFSHDKPIVPAGSVVEVEKLEGQRLIQVGAGFEEIGEEEETKNSSPFFTLPDEKIEELRKPKKIIKSKK